MTPIKIRVEYFSLLQITGGNIATEKAVFYPPALKR